MDKNSEDILVQKTTADYLLNELQWDESIHAMNERLGPEGTLGRNSERDMVLTRYLGEKLMELNPGLPEKAYQDALKIVAAESSSANMQAANREKAKLHKDGVEVTFQDDKGKRITKRLRLFDFANPENNHFLVVRELWVQGEVYRRRPDIVGFVNGIPLVHIELKNVDKDVQEAYEKNLLDYKDTIPNLFHHNGVVILGNGLEAKIGSISSKYEHFNHWKRLHEDEAGIVNMETLLKGTCGKTELLDIVENFIVFDESSGDLVKIVARNHQFLGVNEAIRAVPERKEREGKLGVFWHTQGSGKSYSLLFYARKIHRKQGGNFTFLILTDREDLDDQIYDTFVGCGLANDEKDPCRAKSGVHLKTLLGEQKPYIFTTIQKFNQKVEPDNPYSHRDDIIVISDEAHRSQYGDFATNMRTALPNANFIGFTGTPLFSEKEITQRVFGGYISTYDFKRAVDDGATVPLFYDARGDDLVFKDDDGKKHSVSAPKGMNKKIADKLAELEIDDINVEQRLEKALKRDYHIITASNRLKQIAKDFVKHYANGWETGKAMIVCLDKITCARMYDLIQKYWQEHITFLESDLVNALDEQDKIWRQQQINWMKETLMALVISEEQGEVAKFREWGFDIIPHRKLMKTGFPLTEGKRLKIEDAFKKKDHPFRVSIVCAMWLTGFDVPTLSTLYLDKPLQAHTLMQAIARANRVAEGKNNGLIVDYCGILKSLRKALSTFAGRGDNGRGNDSEGGEQNPAPPKECLLEELKEALTMTCDFLQKQGFILNKILEADGFERIAIIAEAKEAVNENDETRKRFSILARIVLKKFRACLNIPEALDYRDERDAINIIYKSLQNDQEKVDIGYIMRQLHAIVDDAIDTTAVSDSGARNDEPFDISKIDFERLRKEFEASNIQRTTVQNLKVAVEDRLKKLLFKNPLRTDFQEHYEKLVREYNQEKNRVVIEKTFEELLNLVKRIGDEEARALKEGLNEETLALFDILKKPELSKREIKKIKQVAAELLDNLKAEQLKVANWRDKEGTRDAVRQRIYDFLYDDKTGLPVDNYEEEDIDMLTGVVYQHVYRAYPRLPSPVYATVQ